MATGDEHRFAIPSPVSVPPRRLSKLLLEQRDVSPHVRSDNGGVVFQVEGWYEVLLRVDWSITNRDGTRFAHTKIPDQEPLHSEAINATVLADISGGRQLLRGNSLFGPDRTTCLALEVWHDAPEPIEIEYGELVVRELVVPWSGT